MIDLFYPYIPDEAADEVAKVLRSRWVGQGPKVDEFEREFDRLFGTSNSVALNSGTSALETAYDLIGIGPGDEVISTPLTCTATNLPLLARGAKIVWADIREDTLTSDPKDILAKVTPRTKAVVHVHLGGVESCLGKMPVPVVSDACQAMGVFNGDFTCCSFQAIKHITTGDGGMLTVNNPEQARTARLMRWFGIDREKKIKNNWQAYTERKMTFDIEILGYKRQMTDIDAALGIVGLRHYHEVLDHRTNLYKKYLEGLAGIDGIKIVGVGHRSIHWLMTVLVKRRDEFAKMMFEAGVDTNIVQVRNDLYKIFGGRREELPCLNRVEGEYISLPIGMNVTEEDVGYICDAIKSGW